MSVERNLPLIRERKQAILAGDPERIADQKKLNKLTARERIGLLFDEDSFVETDVLAGRASESGVVTGYGLIDGRAAYAYAQDYTVMGGAVGAESARKILKIMNLAEKTGSPVVAIFDSMGARLKEGVDAVSAYAQIAAQTAKLSGVVPQIALVLGQCAASAAMIAALNDVVIAAEDTRLFMNGPQLVSANTGVQVDAVKLGGPEACAASGIAQLIAKEDSEAIYLARKVIGYLPANNLEDAPVDLAQLDDPNRPVAGFDAIDGVSDIRELVAAVADAGSVLEFAPAHAGEMLTALAQLGGRTVGFVATQPAVDGGALTAAGCRKAARFVRFCDSFNVEVVTFCDSVGLGVAEAAKQGEMARATAELMAAYADASVGRVSLVTGNAIAASYMILAARSSADMVYVWPGSVVAPLNAAAAVQVLMANRLKGASDAQAARAALEKEYMDEVADGLNAAKQGYADDVIEPADTRKMLFAALEMLCSKRDARLPKKHGNMPL